MPRRSKAVTALARIEHQPAEVQASELVILKLTARIREIKGQTYRYLVDVSRELGDVLHEGRALFDSPRGYNRWLDALDISASSARNFTNLARLARDAPGAYERSKLLGPAKIYRVARLPSKAREKVLRNNGIVAMTDADFAELCRPYLKPRREVTGNMRGYGMVQKALGMRGKLEKWELPEIDSPEVRKQLKAELQRVVQLARELVRKL